jgi:HEAT repeat protein
MKRLDSKDYKEENEMTKISRIILPSLTLLVILTAALNAEEQEPNGLTTDELFVRAVEAKGDEYTKLRTEILKRPNAENFLKTKLQDEDWKVGVIAKAMLDRSERPDDYLEYEDIIASLSLRSGDRLSPWRRMESKAFIGKHPIATKGMMIGTPGYSFVSSKDAKHAKFKDDEAFAFLAELALKGKDMSKCYAVIRLSWFENPMATPVLIEILQGDDRQAKYYVAKHIQDTAALPQLRQMIKNNKEELPGHMIETIEQAINAVGRFNDNQSLPVLKHLLLSSEHYNIRAASAEALMQIADPNAVDALVQAIRDKDYKVQHASTLALAQIDYKQLLNFLDDDNPKVRREVVWAMGKVASVNSVKPLMYSLNDPDEFVRSFATRGLGRIGDQRAVEPLIQVLKTDSSLSVRHIAAKALGKIGDRRAVEPLIDALSSMKKSVRDSAAEALGELGDPRAIEPLKALQKEEIRIRREVAEALYPDMKFDDKSIAETSIDPATSSLSKIEDKIRKQKAQEQRKKIREQQKVKEQLSKTSRFKVAAVQAISGFGSPEVNRRHLTKLVREAAKQGAKVVVLPETAITGYMSWDIKMTWQRGDMKLTQGLKGTSCEDACETIEGESVKSFARLADELDIYLTVPFLEKETEEDKYYNTVVLVGPEGDVLAHYRKINPWPWAEQGWASKGDLGNVYVDTPYGRMGLLICYDINYEPENLKKLNVDHLLYSIAWVDSANSDWFDVRLGRIARVNNINIIGANWTIPSASNPPDWYGYGKTRIIDRNGRILSKATKDISEEIVYADLEVPQYILKEAGKGKPKQESAGK